MAPHLRRKAESAHDEPPESVFRRAVCAVCDVIAAPQPAAPAAPQSAVAAAWRAGIAADASAALIDATDPRVAEQTRGAARRASIQAPVAALRDTTWLACWSARHTAQRFAAAVDRDQGENALRRAVAAPLRCVLAAAPARPTTPPPLPATLSDAVNEYVRCSVLACLPGGAAAAAVVNGRVARVPFLPLVHAAIVAMSAVLSPGPAGARARLGGDAGAATHDSTAFGVAVGATWVLRALAARDFAVTADIVAKALPRERELRRGVDGASTRQGNDTAPLLPHPSETIIGGATDDLFLSHRDAVAVLTELVGVLLNGAADAAVAVAGDDAGTLNDAQGRDRAPELVDAITRRVFMLPAHSSDMGARDGGALLQLSPLPACSRTAFDAALRQLRPSDADASVAARDAVAAVVDRLDAVEAGEPTNTRTAAAALAQRRRPATAPVRRGTGTSAVGPAPTQRDGTEAAVTLADVLGAMVDHPGFANDAVVAAPLRRWEQGLRDRRAAAVAIPSHRAPTTSSQYVERRRFCNVDTPPRDVPPPSYATERVILDRFSAAYDADTRALARPDALATASDACSAESSPPSARRARPCTTTLRPHSAVGYRASHVASGRDVLATLATMAADDAVPPDGLREVMTRRPSSANRLRQRFGRVPAAEGYKVVPAERHSAADAAATAAMEPKRVWPRPRWQPVTSTPVAPGASSAHMKPFLARAMARPVQLRRAARFLRAQPPPMQ